MDQVIGEAAGKVWDYLNGNGQASSSAIARKTGLPKGVADRAIGWLAREDKLAFERVKNTEMIRLL